MRDRTTTIILAALFSIMILQPSFAHAAETRGLRVVAKDPASGQTGEVKLNIQPQNKDNNHAVS